MGLTAITDVGVVQNIEGPTGYFNKWSHPVLVNLPLFAGILGKDTKGRAFVYVNLPIGAYDKGYMLFQRYPDRENFWVCDQTGATGKFEEVLESVVKKELL